ncbi:MAG: hypothetical protein EZS28_011552 [Streblomastix strix]|uniref:Integrase catalytic domain-containing protein n=1 Tax=Streblomastix strix TaxID=222440 RepID=A0A5J4WDB5_9EUKA|nr:MAG: hypothetical protein EZS28_011552 [Streblomastix strix]
MLPLFELLPSNTTEFIAIQLEKIDINWHEILQAIWQAAIKFACESKIYDIQIGGKSISDWYDIYLTKAQQYNTPKKEAKSIRRVSQQSQDNEQDDQLSLFPFRSKIKQYEKINKEKISIPTQIKDIKVKPLSKLQRPYFSPKIGSWEIDIIFGTNPLTRRTRLYLFAININTKYLVVIPMKDKSSDQLKIALKKLMKQVYVNNIRGDGETGFKANVIKQLVVDSVIRTIRNGFGQDLISFANPNKMQQIVDIYNKTPHLAYQNQFTPQQVQLSRDLEGKFIRQKQQQLELQLINQQREQLFDFKSGNILMVHVDYSRTGIRFQKQRRQFNELATFITYKNGNVVCQLLNPYEGITTNETKQTRKRQPKQVVPQLIEKQTAPIEEVLQTPINAPIFKQSQVITTPLTNTQQEQERTEFRGRTKKYTSQEEAERVAAEQRQRAQQRYRIQRQEFRSSANDLQLILIRRLQKTVVTNMQDLLQISEIIDRYNQ